MPRRRCSPPTRRSRRSPAPTTCSSTCTPRRRARRSRSAGTSTARVTAVVGHPHPRADSRRARAAGRDGVRHRRRHDGRARRRDRRPARAVDRGDAHAHAAALRRGRRGSVDQRGADPVPARTARESIESVLAAASPAMMHAVCVTRALAGGRSQRGQRASGSGRRATRERRAVAGQRPCFTPNQSRARRSSLLRAVLRRWTSLPRRDRFHVKHGRDPARSAIAPIVIQHASASRPSRERADQLDAEVVQHHRARRRASVHCSRASRCRGRCRTRAASRASRSRAATRASRLRCGASAPSRGTPSRGAPRRAPRRPCGSAAPTRRARARPGSATR